MQYKKIRYDFECAIELFSVCNYRCEYCSGPRVKKRLRRGRTKSDIEQVVNFFNASGRTWLIGMSGGEPTIHPFFGEIVSRLRDHHFFYFFTNLSFDVERFMELLPADRVQFMKTSLHPQADLETFLGRFETLFCYGYNPVLIIVSAPHTFERIEYVARWCADRQYPFTLSVMEGPYRDGNYPHDYTPEQVAFIERHTAEPGNLLRLHTRASGGMNTLGLDCPAGKNSFFLDMESGDLMVCESVNKVLGNIYQGTFSPQTQNTRCPAINGCVGYDRSLTLPEAYRAFFTEGWNYWHVQDVKAANNYPDNLFLTIKADNTLAAHTVENALEAVRQRLGSARTLCWGAGIYGTKLVQHLRELYGQDACPIVGFVDSLKDRQTTTVLGLPVYAPDPSILNGAEKILITSYAYEQDILACCQQLDIKSEVVALHQDLLKPLGIEAAIF